MEQTNSETQRAAKPLDASGEAASFQYEPSFLINVQKCTEYSTLEIRNTQILNIIVKILPLKCQSSDIIHHKLVLKGEIHTENTTMSYCFVNKEHPTCIRKTYVTKRVGVTDINKNR